MKRLKSLSIVMAMAIAVVVGLPSVVHAGKSAGTVKNKVQVLMEYSDGTTLPIPESQVGVAGGVLNTKFLLGSDYHSCDDSGKVEFKQTSRITDMYFKLPQTWENNVESAKAEYSAKLMGTFKYHNYKVESNKIKNNRFRVGMPLAWTTVDMKIFFKAKSFEVIFNNGLGQETVRTVEYLKNVKKPSDPSLEGHTFLGWYQGENKFDFDKTPITKNIELKAKWEKNKYTVSFDSAGGTAVESQTVVYGEKVKQPEVPEKEGHTFLGWYQGENLFDFNTEIKENISLTAKWEMIPQTPKLVINLRDANAGMFGYFHLLATDENGADLDLKDIVKAVSVDNRSYTITTSKQLTWGKECYYIEGNKLYMKELNNGQIVTITDNNGTEHRYEYLNKTLTLIP